MRAAVQRIVDTFGGRLAAFKFPPGTAALLQEYVRVEEA